MGGRGEQHGGHQGRAEVNSMGARVNNRGEGVNNRGKIEKFNHGIVSEKGLRKKNYGK